MILCPGILLAAGTPATPAEIGRTLLWAGILLAAAAAIMLAGYVLLRRLKSGAPEPEDGADDPVGFTLDDLRRLHRDGQLTDEEFARAKARVLAALGAGLADEEAEDPPSSAGAPSAAPPDAPPPPGS
jgi:hypothetical protein